jgi:predicted acetyltransferase
MIEFALEKDIDELLELCIQTHPAKEQPFFEYYFHHCFQDGKSYCIREEDKLVSCMQMQEHALSFNNKVLLCSYIFGVATHVDYRMRGFMDRLMHYTLDVCNQNYLISFVEAYNPKLYKKYGFETVSYRKKFTIANQDLKVKNLDGVHEQINTAEMATLYNEFAKRFDCYYLRDEKYYDNYVETILQNGGRIAFYKNKNQETTGYCVFYEREDMVEIKEVIYLDSLSLTKLLKFAIKFMPYISLEVSNNERIEKIFKRAIPRTSSCVMARINNYSLFEKLYDTKIKNVEEAFEVLRKPVLINEKN